MNHLSEAWWLTKRELKSRWLSFLLTMVFSVLIGALVASGLYSYMNSMLIENAHASDPNVIVYTNPYPYYIDLIFIGLLPALGALYMSSEYMSFQSIKEEPFLKKLTFYRSLPIPVPVLALNRILFMLITLCLMSVTFYTTIYLIIGDTINAYMGGSHFLSFVLLWFGYTLALGGLNPFLEFGTNGKTLFIIFPLIAAFTLIVLFLVLLKFEFGIVESSLLLIQEYGFWPALISLVTGMIGCTSWKKVLERRFKARNLS